MITKLVSKLKTAWDQHLPTVLFAYCTAYKVTTHHTPYQLVYGLQPMLPTKDMIPTYRNDVDKDYLIERVLAARMEDLEKIVKIAKTLTRRILRYSNNDPNGSRVRCLAKAIWYSSIPRAKT